MADHLTRGAQLRTPAPTLEPDEAFLARLSSLAAAGAPAPVGAAAPRVSWRVGLAAASVAAVLVGAAWLGGLGDTEVPAPPSPATTPSGPTTLPSTTTDATSGESSDSSGERGETSTSQIADPDSEGAGSNPSGVPPGQDDPEGDEGSHGTPGAGQGQDPGDQETGHQGPGPDEHAGDHPDEHASELPDNADRAVGKHPAGGAGGRQPR
jgi:hypothetical protein